MKKTNRQVLITQTINTWRLLYISIPSLAQIAFTLLTKLFKSSAI